MADAQGCELQLPREYRPTVKDFMAFSQEPGGGTHPLAPANGFDTRCARDSEQDTIGIASLCHLLIEEETRIGSVI